MTTLTSASFEAVRPRAPDSLKHMRFAKLDRATQLDKLRELGRGRGFTPVQSLSLLAVVGAVRKIRRTEEDEYPYVHEDDRERIVQNVPVSLNDLKAALSASGFDSWDWETVVSYITTEDDSVVQTRDGWLVNYHDGDVFDCAYCRERYYDLASTDVVTYFTTESEFDTQDWCSRCADHYSSTCELSGLLISRRCSYFVQIEVDRVNKYAATRILALRGWVEYPGAGWLHPEDPRAVDYGPATDPVPGYHRAPRNWDQTVTVANRSLRAFYGLEIELLFPTRGRSISFYRAVKRLDPESKHITTERDGSLDRMRGIELITRPFTLGELREDDCILKRSLDKAAKRNATGQHEMEIPEDKKDATHYGIHITTNWQRLTIDHQQRFREFIYNQRKQSILIAGRESNQFAHLDRTRMNDDDRYRGVRPRSLYDPYESAVEIRIFESSIDYGLVMSFVEFIDAVTAWTMDPDHLVKGPLAASLFRSWVCQSGQYPHLSARFTKSTAQEATPACASPSPNPETVPSATTDSGSVSGTTPTEPDSPSARTTARSRSTRDSSTSSRSSRRTTRTASTNETP